jgi:chemotaxis-related protein WspD
MSQPTNAAQQPATAEFHARIAQRQRFFAKPLPEGYAEELAAVLAAVPLAATRLASVLEFRIASLSLAIPLRWVKSVSPLLALCPVPHRDNTAFLGLVAYAGQVIPCCSLARILGAADSIKSDEARTIVLEQRPNERWAFPVDGVLGVNTRNLDAQPDDLAILNTAQLAADWRDALYFDDRGTLIELLRPETLFQRLQRATA